MRLVLVHGRGQKKASEEKLRLQWLEALGHGLTAAGVGPLTDVITVRLPFYGAELDRLVNTPPPGLHTFGPGGLAAEHADLVTEEAQLMKALAERAGLSPEKIQAESTGEYVAFAFPHFGWFKAAARALIKLVPWLDDFALEQFVQDVAAYQTRPDVADAVDRIVADVISARDEEVVVVGHSLGSIVAYNVLQQFARSGRKVRVPLFVTVGAPLGIPAVQRRLAEPLGKPAGVERWFNVAHVDDFVALFAVDDDTFPAAIDHMEVATRQENPHGIVGYLSDPIVARPLADALGL